MAPGDGSRSAPSLSQTSIVVPPVNRTHTGCAGKLPSGPVI
jgi:hypothetical protein